MESSLEFSVVDGEIGFTSNLEVKTTQQLNIWNEDTDRSLMNGSGTLLFKCGNKYEGEFVKGKKWGIGS